MVPAVTLGRLARGGGGGDSGGGQGPDQLATRLLLSHQPDTGNVHVATCGVTRKAPHGPSGGDFVSGVTGTRDYRSLAVPETCRRCRGRRR